MLGDFSHRLRRLRDVAFHIANSVIDGVDGFTNFGEQVANLDSPPPNEDRHLLRLTPVPNVEDPEEKVLQIEALLKERQRAFIELVTTAETLRTKIARLEEMVEERDRELNRLRVVRAS